jgi:hypothetical protein
MTLIAHPHRGDVDANDAVPTRRALLRGAREAIVSVSQRDAVESRVTKHVDELCFQQSAGDSTRPEIDIA